MVVRDLREISSAKRGRSPEDEERTSENTGRVGSSSRLCEPEPSGAVTLGSPAGLCRGRRGRAPFCRCRKWSLDAGVRLAMATGRRRGGESCLGTRDMACLGEDKSVDWGM